jgi:hypothetical protein
LAVRDDTTRPIRQGNPDLLLILMLAFAKIGSQWLSRKTPIFCKKSQKIVIATLTDEKQQSCPGGVV